MRVPDHHPDRDPSEGGRAAAVPDAAPDGRLDADPVVVVLDVANVMGSRPDGWWRDRAGAAQRLVEASAAVVGRSVPDPDAPDGDAPAAGAPDPDAPRGRRLVVAEVVAVVEGRAREVVATREVRVVAAPADGDTTVVEVARELVAAGRAVRVVTADRGLRARLPAAAGTSGPGWWNHLIGR